MKSRSLLILSLLALSAPLANASGIDWGNNPYGSTSNPAVNLYMYNSTGGLLDNSFSFELGTFAAGFTPTSANEALWASNWKVISVAIAPGTNGWSSLDASDPNVNDPTQNPEYFSGSANFNSDGTVHNGGPSIFATGDQAYVWVFNSKALANGSQWALVTDSSPGATSDDVWHVPDPSQTLNLPVLWNLDTADTAVFGSVNGVTGDGTQVVNPGANSLQTFNVAVVVVPEPGSAMMVLVAGVLLRLRRKQRPN